MEAQYEKETRMLQLNTTGHNYSHDSAIDTDLQEWDTEMLNIDLVFIIFLRYQHKLMTLPRSFTKNK